MYAPSCWFLEFMLWVDDVAMQRNTVMWWNLWNNVLGLDEAKPRRMIGAIWPYSLSQSVQCAWRFPE